MSQRIRKSTRSFASTIAVFLLAFVFYAACYANIK